LFNDLPLCKHLHLPVQSGDPDVLQSMHRFYDINKLRKMMDLIQTRFPQFAFGADFITGFPTEDRQSFEKTFEFIRTAPFSYLHIFPYSPRPGTRAFPLGDPVKPEEKHSRVKLLRALGREKSYDFRKRFINQKFMITVERRNGKTSGLTENYIRMIIPAKPYENLIEAQIVKVEFDYTLGKIV
ncbi:MAG: tRNA (N(6)-L-threonylcarbamoyladenosine(37)-C(2))-methylthiotransferase MtaB, partial [candidate division WOR-3 bacterium]